MAMVAANRKEKLRPPLPKLRPLLHQPLPPPPPLSPGVIPLKIEPSPSRLPMARRNFASRGQSIPLLTNHFKIAISRTDGHFFQYNISIMYEDGTPVEAKGIGRRIVEKIEETYAAELTGKKFAYDGENSLFTFGVLPQTKMEFTVVLEDRQNRKEIPNGDTTPNGGDRKRSRLQSRMKSYIVAINFASKIPIIAISNGIRGKGPEQFQEAVRVLDVILRQNAAKQGCLILRQSFIHNEPKNFANIGGGVLACRGLHASFRATQGALSLNMNVTTTIIIQPGPVTNFLLANQNIEHPSKIDWAKAKRTLKNLRIKALNTNRVHKILGISDKICGKQTFMWRQRTGGRDDAKEIQVTVHDYFVSYRKVPLKYSGNLPCIDVGKPKKPIYIPIELCELISLQRYTRAMSSQQRAALVEKSSPKPQERMNSLKEALSSSNYNTDPLLGACGVSIKPEFMRLEGRVLQSPKLKVGNGEEISPRNGKWNFNNKRFVEPIKLERWVIVNFSSHCNMQSLSNDLIRLANMKGMTMPPPDKIFEEKPHLRRAPPHARVQDMLKSVRSGLSKEPHFLLCIFPEKKTSDLYGPWKKKTLCDIGIVNQCAAPSRVNDNYLTNLLLKINVKLGGLNSLLAAEVSRSIPLVSKVPTLIIGIDVAHGSPGRDIPSIAAVVSSRQWPLISRYRASVRAQSSRMEMVDSIFNVVGGKDMGIFREILMDFYLSSGNVKPEHIIIFRDGVSDSQFNQVLNIELEQIIKACKFKDESWRPKFAVVVAQKNHHTRFFMTNSPNNVPPGTVIDKGICHPKHNDFYMCAQAGIIGTTRPTHYHILHDEIGFSPDDLQGLVHSLCHVFQRSTSAISIVAPIRYAHLAAALMSQVVKFDDMSDSGSGGVPELPRLHERVTNSMFFC